MVVKVWTKSHDDTHRFTKYHLVKRMVRWIKWQSCINLETKTSSNFCSILSQLNHGTQMGVACQVKACFYNDSWFWGLALCVFGCKLDTSEALVEKRSLQIILYTLCSSCWMGSEAPSLTDWPTDSALLYIHQVLYQFSSSDSKTIYMNMFYSSVLRQIWPSQVFAP